MTTDIIKEALDRMEEYFDNRADADQPPGSMPIPNEEMLLLTEAQAALSAYEALLKRVGELEADNEALTGSMEICVQERIEELNAEAEAFEKDCWKALLRLCEDQPYFDWNDFDGGMTADDAYQYLTECFTAVADYEDLLKRVKELEAALTNIGIYGCGMLNQPAALNGPEEAWLRARIQEYETVARAALNKESE